jgi:hypothetical protein
VKATMDAINNDGEYKKGREKWIDAPQGFTSLYEDTWKEEKLPFNSLTN